ncbi:MAG: 3-oxoacid CoA-transferase subunit B [Acidiferrobacterales bacterium]
MTMRLTRAQMAWRVAQDIPNGAYVNLGIGMPEIVANYLPEDREIVFHCENGVLGMGPMPLPGEEDYDLISAGKKPITMVPGGAFFNSADSFAMIRGGHIDICVLGAFQVSATGDVANWSTGAPGAVPAVGGAMDLAVGAKRVFVVSEHCTKQGAPKIVERCTYPLTAVGVVNAIFTDLAVIEVIADGLLVRELVEGLTFEELQNCTGAPLTLVADWRTIVAPELA